MKFAILQVSLRESEKKRKTVVVAPTRRKKKMKKFAGIVMALLVVGSLAFATYADPANQSVVISTTIAQESYMSINSTTGYNATDNVISAQKLASGGSYGTVFYVNTKSNLVAGFTLKYTMKPLTGASASNSDTISVMVKTTPNGGEDAVETTIDESKTVEVLKTTSTTGMEENYVAVQVKALKDSWATDVAADTYTADLTFTFTAN